MGIKNRGKTTSSMTTAAQARTAKQAKIAPAKADRRHVPEAVPNAIPTPTTTPALVTVRDSKGRTSTASHPVPKPEELRQKQTAERKAAVKDLVKADAASCRAARVKKLCEGGTTISATTIDGLNATELTQIAKAKGFKGYSGLKKDELVKFLIKGGVKPAATIGSTRALQEKAAALKKAGMITGAVSGASKAQLEKVVAAASRGVVAQIVKPAPKAGTMDANKDKLRVKGGTGYVASYTTLAKAMFGVSISALKSEQLKALVAKLGL